MTARRPVGGAHVCRGERPPECHDRRGSGAGGTASYPMARVRTAGRRRGPRAVCVHARSAEPAVGAVVYSGTRHSYRFGQLIARATCPVDASVIYVRNTHTHKYTRACARCPSVVVHDASVSLARQLTVSFFATVAVY